MVLAHVVCEKIVDERIRYRSRKYGKRLFKISHCHIKIVEPVAILYSMNSTTGQDKMYEGMNGLGVVIATYDLPCNEQDYMCRVHPGVNHIGNEGLPQRMLKELAAHGTADPKGRTNWAPFGLKSTFRRPLGKLEEDFTKYLKGRPDSQSMKPDGRCCRWVSTQTGDGHMYMPSRECWEFVRDFPPAMPAGETSEDSPIPGMGYYLGMAIGVDQGYLQTNDQPVGGELDYFIVCQEQGSNPGDQTGALEAWHVSGLQTRLSRERSMRSVARAERAAGVSSDWTENHGDDHLWGSTPSSVTDQELELWYRGLAAQHFAAFGDGDLTDTVANSEVTADDLASLLLGDDDDWDPALGAPGSSSGDSDAHGNDAPPAGGYDDVC